MKNKDDLRSLLESIDHRGYPNYKSTKGDYRFDGYILHIDHVQGDPFASPSHLTVEVPEEKTGFPREYWNSRHRRIALEDRLLRYFYSETVKVSRIAKGSGKSGVIEVCKPGQEILERSDCRINQNNGAVFLRFRVGFPANGRTINSRELIRMLFDLIPRCVAGVLVRRKEMEAEILRSIELSDDQHAIRKELKEKGLVAFIADGAILPRISGVSQLPMKNAVKFKSPETLLIEIKTPHRGIIRGMGIKKGITLIVGGGYHGKSTLLKALERGVYDHIEGDGREYVITDSDAVKIRAEDGRSVRGTDISMFITNLPDGRNTNHFTTEDASGSTSQAANVAEAIEAGSHTLLIDEDTCATNFMIRDELMQQVIQGENEPIKPFFSRIRQLRGDGISTVLVAGSFGAYFKVSDTVIQMDRYHTVDITKKAKAASEGYSFNDAGGTGYQMPDVKRRPARLTKEYTDFRIKTKILGLDGFIINHETVSLRYLEQIVDTGQNTGLCMALLLAGRQLFDGHNTISDIVEKLMEIIEKDGPEALFAGRTPEAGVTVPRRQEVFACINRFRPMMIL